MRPNASRSVIGLPHSGHSGGVSGSVSSSIVLRTSTNGTSAMMPREELRPHVRDGAHQQSAGRAAMRDDAALRARSLARSGARPRRRNRVKVFSFLRELAVAVPAPAFFGAAADVRDRVDEAAIDERQPVGAETDAGIAMP